MESSSNPNNTTISFSSGIHETANLTKLSSLHGNKNEISSFSQLKHCGTMTLFS